MPLPIIGPIVSGIVGAVIKYFSQTPEGNKLGTVVTDVGALAALAPLGYWLVTHKDELAVCVSYGQLAFFGLLVFALVKVAHYTRAGRPENRNGGSA